MGSNTKETRDTAKSLRRSIEILKSLGESRKRGFSLSEISRATGLPHPTTLRLLRHLTEMGMVAWDPLTKIYRLGSLTFELGLAASEHCDIRGLCAESLDRLESKTQDTAYLTVRSGFEAVCLDRREGGAPIRALTLDIGSRRPLGVGAAGLAILHLLPEEEISEIINAAEPKLHQFNRMNLTVIRMLLEDTRQRGYAVCGNWVTLGITAVAIPLCFDDGRPFGSLSISSVNSRMHSVRWPEIASLLQAEASIIQTKINSSAKNYF
jgi:DNA-binding IclR family transcriptional regulator